MSSIPGSGLPLDVKQMVRNANNWELQILEGDGRSYSRDVAIAGDGIYRTKFTWPSEPRQQHSELSGRLGVADFERIREILTGNGYASLHSEYKSKIMDETMIVVILSVGNRRQQVLCQGYYPCEIRQLIAIVDKSIGTPPQRG